MSDSEDDDEVGYGKPPRATRFKKGVSGNVKGRPKGAKGFRAKVREELASTISISQGGQPERVSKLDGVVKRLVAKALKGDGQAIKLLISLDMEGAGQASGDGHAAAESTELTQTDEAMLARFAYELLGQPEHTVDKFLRANDEDAEEEP